MSQSLDYTYVCLSYYNYFTKFLQIVERYKYTIHLTPYSQILSFSSQNENSGFD
jgi:hypothetical protein